SGVTDNVGHQISQTYGTDYDRDTTGKRIDLYVNNYTGRETSEIRIDVDKLWKDDSDNSQRSKIKVSFGTYDDSGSFNPVYRNSDKSSPYEFELSAAKDYTNHIWVNPEDFMTDDEKTAYDNAPEDQKAALRAAAVRDHLSIKPVLFNENTNDYDREIKHPVFSGESGKKTLTGGIIEAVVDNDFSRPGYKVSITRNGNDFVITNVRVAGRTFTFKKNWVDSQNVLKGRGDFLRVALFREMGGVEKEIAYIDIPTYEADGQTLSDGDDLKVTFDKGGAYYPAYDENGNNYIYSIKEYICTGKPATGENLCDVNGNEAYTPSSKKEVITGATTETTNTGYVVETAEPVVSTMETDGLHDLGYQDAKSMLIKEEYSHTNKAAGKRGEVDFYCLWYDQAKSDERPDIYFTLYYDGGENGELIPYTGSYTERWVDVYSGNKFVQKAIFTGVPIADENGRVYTYYAAETLNNATTDYTADRYVQPLFNENGNTYNNEVVEDALNGQPVLKNNIEKNQAVASDGKILIKENSFVANTISETIRIEGRKLWLYIPEGIEADKLPAAKIYLFRESEYDKANAVPQ
ncbi:MAG: Cna B-type domain-containing protein, partial [Lachnospiraceae bacterium]|nr:Cna B-type domain-containing protein [Lachnospiraceae bacterium]